MVQVPLKKGPYWAPIGNPLECSTAPGSGSDPHGGVSITRLVPRHGCQRITAEARSRYTAGRVYGELRVVPWLMESLSQFQRLALRLVQYDPKSPAALFCSGMVEILVRGVHARHYQAVYEVILHLCFADPV